MQDGQDETSRDEHWQGQEKEKKKYARSLFAVTVASLSLCLSQFNVVVVVVNGLDSGWAL